MTTEKDNIMSKLFVIQAWEDYYNGYTCSVEGRGAFIVNAISVWDAALAYDPNWPDRFEPVECPNALLFHAKCNEGFIVMDLQDCMSENGVIHIEASTLPLAENFCR